MRDYRFQPKKQNVFLKQLKLLIFLVLIIFSTVFLTYWVRETAFFKVKNFEVKGNESIDEKTIIDELELLVTGNSPAGFFGGDNIFVWGNGDFSGLYSKYPRLESISVTKDLFRGKVMIEVKEREKFVAWCLVSIESCYWIDVKGEVFDKAPLVQGRIVKAVKDYSENRSLNIGERILTEDELNNLNKIFELLDKLNLTAKELKVEDIKFKEINAFLEDGPEIRFGLNVDPTFGAPVIKSLLDSSEWPKIRYVDLRVQDRVYYSR